MTPTNFTGNRFDTTARSVIGRLPWRTLGLEPLRDGHGECLWYRRFTAATSAPASPGLPPMNWDSLSHLDIVVANGTAALASTLASAHERPVAVIFSPGPPLTGPESRPDPEATT